MSYEYIHIGVSLLYRLDSLGGGYEVDQLYILAPCALNYVNARVGAAAGSSMGSTIMISLSEISEGSLQ